ncbi:hypothetical protein DFH09DRAFT_955094 [Mycena vulgaris]|nr:hypothetical protein DFH09DRAFT_955094 [Mycena vulgaris]
MAALHAARCAPSNAALSIEGRSSTVMTAMNTHLQKWEDTGWIGVPNPAPLQALTACLCLRQEETSFTVVRDAANRPAYKAAAALARAAEAEAEINLSVPAGARMSGAKLSKMTQKYAYLKIRSLKETPARKTTESTIALVQAFEKSRVDHAPSPEIIWQSIRHKDITRQIKSWLWKSMHGAHRVGSYWTHIPGFEERATCSFCDQTESLPHILFECPRPGQARIWELVAKLWKKKSGAPLPTPSMGMVLGSALAKFEDESKLKPSGLNRLYRILISESAYLIWKLRNESVIQNDGRAPSVFEVHNRWVSLINDRLKIDQFMASQCSDQNKILVLPEVVLQTWSRTLLDEVKLPKDWLREPRVLVGIGTVSSHHASPPLSRRNRHS